MFKGLAQKRSEKRFGETWCSSFSDLIRVGDPLRALRALR